MLEPLHIWWMIHSDMPEVIEIERLSFDDPFYEQDFRDLLRRRHCIGMICEHRERVVGYMIYELHKQRFTLISLAVHPKYRLRDVGRRMVQKIVGKLSRGARRHIEIDVHESNLTAHLFLRSCGLICTGIDGEYYHFVYSLESACKASST